MIAIADYGATKADWVLLDDVGQVKFSKSTLGFNPNNISHTLELDQELCDKLKGVKEIYYYGAGVNNKELGNKIKVALAYKFGLKSEFIHVYNDLVGSGRALFGTQKGIACILGTGSNVAHYNGENVYMDTPSLGHMISDEGSAYDIGRSILQDYFYKIMPEEYLELFAKQNPDLDSDSLIINLYGRQLGSSYVASYAQFLEHVNHEWKDTLLKTCFDTFYNKRVKNLCIKYSGPIGFTGSVAYFYGDILKQVFAKKGIENIKIMRSPMDGLIEYHKNKLHE